MPWSKDWLLYFVNRHGHPPRAHKVGRSFAEGNPFSQVEDVPLDDDSADGGTQMEKSALKWLASQYLANSSLVTGMLISPEL